MSGWNPDPSWEIRRLREAMPDRRERIATAALAGMLANTQWLPKDTTYEQISNYAVRAADALIAELDKEVKP